MKADITDHDNWDSSSQAGVKSEPSPVIKGEFMFDMIANCAHDLKTPLAAIYSSNQLAISILSDLQAVLAQQSPLQRGLLDDLDIAKSTLESSLNMTEFMKMSINRCMDYTKVKNHSMKLSPKNGTIDVAQAFELPLKCMMSVDSEQVIEMKPLPSDMCSHVITDQQWLQENVLCLTSNASKYSSKGTITLTVSLVPESVIVHSDDYGLRDTFGSYAVGTTSYTDSDSVYEDRAISVDPTQEASHDTDIHNSSTRSLINLNCQSSTNLNGKQMVVVEVEDTGIGLSEEGMASLFTPFKQAQRLAGGTGLGLFSLANRIEALQGHCGVRGRRDGKQGCLFWFAFPYKPDEEAAEAALEQDLTAESLAQFSAQQSQHTDPSGAHMSHQPSLLRIIVPGSNNNKPSRQELISSASSSLPEQFPPLSPGQSQAQQDAITPSITWRQKHSSSEILVPRARRTAAASPSVSKDQLQTPPRPTPRTSCPPSPAAESEHFAVASTGDSQSVDYDMLATDETLHILLVDDTPSILKICCRTLRREGYRVTTAENGLEALKLLRSATVFDAVLMDLQMPVLDGLETVLRYRAEEVIPEGKRRLFIVAVSANSDPNIAQGAIEAGFDGFIEKPFTIKGLQEVLPEDLGMDAYMLRQSDSVGTSLSLGL